MAFIWGNFMGNDQDIFLDVSLKVANSKLQPHLPEANKSISHLSQPYVFEMTTSLSNAEKTNEIMARSDVRTQNEGSHTG